MTGRGREKETISLYDKYVKGKEEILIADCRNGADIKGLAKRLGIGPTTFNKIKRLHPELRDVLRDGLEEADMKVESALYRRAIGFDYEETSTEVRVDADGNETATYVKKTKKHVPGDTTAQIFWLKNRKPESWRDRQDVNVTNDSWVEALKALNDEHEDKRGSKASDN